MNLDPAAETFTYSAMGDVRDLIQVDDVMQAEDLDFGPNGGLIFCMEYLTEPDGLDWLKVCRLFIYLNFFYQVLLWYFLHTRDDNIVRIVCPCINVVMNPITFFRSSLETTTMTAFYLTALVRLNFTHTWMSWKSKFICNINDWDTFQETLIPVTRIL